MILVKVALLLVLISITVHAQERSTQQHLTTLEEHNAVVAAAKTTTPPKKVASAANAKDASVKTNSKTSTLSKTQLGKGKPISSQQLQTTKLKTTSTSLGKPSAQGGKPHANAAQSNVKTQVANKVVASQKTNKVQTKTNLKGSLINSKATGKIDTKNTHKVNNKKQPVAPIKQVKKVIKNPDNCYHSIDKAGVIKLQAYLPIRTRGQLSCKNRSTCFLGFKQLHKYLEAINEDAKCKCIAKTAKKNDVVKCQVKALTGFDKDDNPLHIYYRFNKDGKFNLSEIKSVTVEFRAEEHKGKDGKSVVSWGVSAAYPAQP